MSDIYITMYTKEHGKVELTEDERNFFHSHTITFHREDGPTIIYYYNNGTIRAEYYYINDLCHRSDGPARIYYNRDGDILSERYWINGKRYAKEDYWKEIKILNNRSNILKLLGES